MSETSSFRLAGATALVSPDGTVEERVLDHVLRGETNRSLPAVAALLLAAVTACAPQRQAPAPAARPPNIVLIFIDDMGFADAGFNGCTDIKTPNLDRLAARGVRYDRAFATIGVCAPARSTTAM